MVRNTRHAGRTLRQALAKALVCSVLRHAPRLPFQHNEGHDFTRCRACGCDLVRAGARPWRQPRGYRVVWPDSTPRPIFSGASRVEAAEAMTPLDPKQAEQAAALICPAGQAAESNDPLAAAPSSPPAQWPYPATASKPARTRSERRAERRDPDSRSAMELLQILYGVRPEAIALPDLSVADELPSPSLADELPSPSLADELPSPSLAEDLANSSLTEELPELVLAEDLPDPSFAGELPELLLAEEWVETAEPSPPEAPFFAEDPAGSVVGDFMTFEDEDEFNWQAHIGLKNSGGVGSAPGVEVHRVSAASASHR